MLHSRAQKRRTFNLNETTSDYLKNARHMVYEKDEVDSTLKIPTYEHFLIGLMILSQSKSINVVSHNTYSNTHPIPTSPDCNKRSNKSFFVTFYASFCNKRLMQSYPKNMMDHHYLPKLETKTQGGRLNCTGYIDFYDVPNCVGCLYWSIMK